MRLSLLAPLVAGSLLCAQSASAQCQRPNDPGGINGYDYGVAPVSSFDGKSVRVWYTTTGVHAVNPATTRMDMVPDNVVTAATVADAALATYAQMGFKAPISDNGTGSTCGGTPALDLYLMHFNAADGDTAIEGCKSVGPATQCWSFGQVEARLEKIYGTFELGAHVVIAHELFHSIQDAYDQTLDHFWAEGTAQWAAKTAYPAEMDFEGFLPAFFQAADKSIDIAGGGVVADYLYGSAIWPQFLTEHVGPTAVRGAFEQEAKLGPPSMKAIDASLPALSSSLADAYPTFAAWNAGTGKRAGTGGYANAATYPEVALTALPDGGVSAIITGYSVFYYSYDFGATTQQLTLQGDPTRLGARTFPLVGGKARLDQIATLPATVSGAGVLVVAGVSGKKADAPFTITAAPPPSNAPDAGPTPPGTTTTTTTTGCTVGSEPSSNAWSLGVLAGVLLIVARRRRN